LDRVGGYDGPVFVAARQVMAGGPGSVRKTVRVSFVGNIAKLSNSATSREFRALQPREQTGDTGPEINLAKLAPHPRSAARDLLRC
jgi:hypothetical protein